jgi:peptidoglycan/LPS O-acetylase OafA/YrhL
MKEKNAEIEALRAAAICITLAAHLGWIAPSLMPYLGYFWLGGGVDLFFCISGFVITSSLLREMEKSNDFISVAMPFWIRRISRLWPASIAWAMIALAIAITFNRSGVFGPIANNIDFAIAGLFQIANLHIAACAATTSAFPCPESILGVYWSLSLEEQFYVIFPLLLIFVRRQHLILALCTAIAIQFFTLREWPSLGWFVRTDAICFGVLIAIAHHRKAFDRIDIRFMQTPLIRIPLTVTLIAGLILVGRTSVIPFYHGMVAAISAILVLLASQNACIIVNGNISRKLSAYVGSRSYSLYLTHALAFCITREWYFREFGGTPTSVRAIAASIALSVGLALMLAEISVRLIENPIRNRGRKLSRRVVQRNTRPASEAPNLQSVPGSASRSKPYIERQMSQSQPGLGTRTNPVSMKK